MTKIKVLCVTDYYLPGYKAGGPIRTISNMSDILAGEVDFSIVTRDRDMGDDEAFDSVQANEWQTVGSSPVYYASPKTFGARAIERTFDNHDILYLNSFFSIRGSIEPYLRFRNRTKILIAPRGEFSKGALALKPLRKRAFLVLAKLLGFYRDVQWHASTGMEAADIERVFPNAKGRIQFAIDPVVMSDSETPVIARRHSTELKIVFISRISPKKNLDGLLNILQKLEKPASLTIYGPNEDEAYWARCQGLIAKLPKNIRVTYAGMLEAGDVSAAFAEHDLFAFPTHGENFGHVIFESLSAGTPVLLSDQTPWTTDVSGAVTVVPLGAHDEWRAQLEMAAAMPVEERQALRAATLEYARQYALNGETRTDNIRMFSEVANWSAKA